MIPIEEKEKIRKIMIAGGAGLIGRIIAMDLVESKGVDEIVIADYFEEKAKEVAASFNDSRVSGCFIDAKDIDAMASLMERYDAVINSTLPGLNLSIMKACLKAHCHYNDLGGLFHATLQQLELFNDFKEAGLSAVLCIGSAPGVTNIMARYAYDRLDSVDTVRLFVASVDLNEREGLELFIPPYSIRTVMDEYYLESVQFIDGEFKTFPPLGGEMEMVFPDPIGKALCHHTLHSEPALLSKSFKDKGVKEVTWRLSLPPKFESKSIFLASIGFADEEAIQVKGQSVYPKDVLEAILERYLKE